jgi:hypothetical protein
MTGVNSDIDVCNKALILLGSGTINSFTEGTDKALACANQYPALRDFCLGMHPWRFAMAKAKLGRLNASPLNEWQYAFQLPNEVGDIDGGPWAVFNTGRIHAHPIQEFEIFGEQLAANHKEIWIDYKFRASEAKWPAWFVELVATALAAKLAPTITDIAALAEEWNARAWGTRGENYGGGLALVAMNRNAMTSPPIQIQDFSLVDARFS